jgi:Leucine-rich repeat (LRR) protein
VKELPKEIWSLQQLNTLDITHTKITQLPKGIKKLQHLEHLFMSGTKVKIPREIGSLKELKSLKLIWRKDCNVPIQENNILPVRFIWISLN